MLATSDGLFLDGEFGRRIRPEHDQLIAPQLFKKVGRLCTRTQGRLDSTVHDFSPTTTHQHLPRGDVYLIVIHDASDSAKHLWRRCERISQKLAG